MRRLPASVKGALASQVRKSRRGTIYRMMKKRCAGTVPCFVCGVHVDEADATLEHIVPIAKGGKDDMSNLSISHRACNNKRGCDSISHPQQENAMNYVGHGQNPPDDKKKSAGKSKKGRK